MSIKELVGGVFPDGSGRRLEPLKTESLYSAKQHRADGRREQARKMNALRGLLLEAHRAEYHERAREFCKKDLMNGGRTVVSRSFGKVLKEYRRKVGHTQEELAQVAGIDRTYPSLLERGRRVPTLVVFIGLACALKIAPVELFCTALDALRQNTKWHTIPERVTAFPKNLMNVGRSDISRSFGHVLKEYRLKVGYTQEELADVAAMDRTYPSLLERGKRVPTLPVLIGLACALKIAPIELFCTFLDKLRQNTAPA